VSLVEAWALPAGLQRRLERERPRLRGVVVCWVRERHTTTPPACTARRRSRSYQELPPVSAGQAQIRRSQAQMADLVDYAGNNEIQCSSGLSGDGETRTRTGDTTIFSRAVRAEVTPRNPWKSMGLHRLAAYLTVPQFAGLSTRFRRWPTSHRLLAAVCSGGEVDVGVLEDARIRVGASVACCDARRSSLRPSPPPRRRRVLRGDSSTQGDSKRNRASSHRPESRTPGSAPLPDRPVGAAARRRHQRTGTRRPRRPGERVSSMRDHPRASSGA
jgi:hypothetical protein